MKRAIILLVTIAILVAGTLGWLAWHHSAENSAIPANIKSQISFKASVPSGDYSIISGTVKYDSKQALLTMQVTGQGANPVVVTEQPYPDTLIYDKLIGTMSAEREVGNSLGKATVTHPKSAPGKEVVVVQADNTLMFISSDNKLNDSEWRALLNSLAN